MKVVENTPVIVESFIDSFTVSEKTGNTFSKEILNKIEKDGPDITDCREDRHMTIEQTWPVNIRVYGHEFQKKSYSYVFTVRHTGCNWIWLA